MKLTSNIMSCTIGSDEGYNFDYTGAIQTFTAPKTGIYSLETWGAQGGDATDGTHTARGGYGAYAYGEVLLQQGETVYINVGGQNGYGGGGKSNEPIHCITQWLFNSSNKDLLTTEDFSVITSTMKNATSPTTDTLYSGDSHSFPSWADVGDVIYHIEATTNEQIVFVESDYIKLWFGKYDGNSYGFCLWNKVADSKILSGGELSFAGQKRDFYVGIIVDTPNQRAYIIIGDDKYNDRVNNKFYAFGVAGMYNGVDLFWETFKDC